jgi:hypothetical protein
MWLSIATQASSQRIQEECRVMPVRSFEANPVYGMALRLEPLTLRATKKAGLRPPFFPT